MEGRAASSWGSGSRPPAARGGKAGTQVSSSLARAQVRPLPPWGSRVLGVAPLAPNRWGNFNRKSRVPQKGLFLPTPFFFFFFFSTPGETLPTGFFAKLMCEFECKRVWDLPCLLALTGLAGRTGWWFHPFQKPRWGAVLRKTPPATWVLLLRSLLYTEFSADTPSPPPPS